MKQLTTLMLLVTFFQVAAQKKTYELSKLLSDGKLSVYNRNATIFQDGSRKGVKLNEDNGEGIVWLREVTFSQGVIEIDLRGQDVFQKSFLGIAFHGVNDSTYEAIYFRPFNFHAKDSIRKIHAVQYISHPLYTWRKLREERNGCYEKPLINPPDPNRWFRARIEISNDQVRVFVNDDTDPSLTVEKLSTVSSGKIGLWVGDGSGGDFSNLIISKKD